MVQLSHPYMTTGKTIALTVRTFMGEVMPLLFNMLSRFVIAFLPRSNHLLILWLQSPFAVIWGPKKIKSDTVSIKSFPCGSIGKESACNAGDLGLYPRLGRYAGEGMATHSSILALRIPWTEESGRLQFMGSQESDMT